MHFCFNIDSPNTYVYFLSRVLQLNKLAFSMKNIKVTWRLASAEHREEKCNSCKLHEYKVKQKILFQKSGNSQQSYICTY